MTKREPSWIVLMLVVAAFGVAAAMGFVHCDEHNRPYWGAP